LGTKHKIIHMFSGGLDSILAAKIMRDEGFEVIALHFYTGFNDSVERLLDRGPNGKWSPKPGVVNAAERLGVTLLPMDVGGDYLDIVTKPKYGYGSAANPCIDCRIFLLGKAREVMERENAVLVSTGEVLGQRPMSQHRSALRQVEKLSGLDGRLLRPLSAKLLEPTIAEKEGIVNRDRLYDLQGRSRKRQKELAERFGIDFYPSPGGGCILTAEQFGEKFFDLLRHSKKDEITLTHLNTLLTGRHLRTGNGVKVVMGRNKKENDFLSELLDGRFWCFEARDFKGPSAFALDEPPKDDFPVIASVTARYGKGMNEESVVVTARRGGDKREFRVKPAAPDETAGMLINRG